MRAIYSGLVLSLVLILAFFDSDVANERIKTFTFEGVNSINIQTVSGNIRICAGGESKFMVELKNDLEKPEWLSPTVEADHGELSIEEHFTGNNVRGETYWTVYLPKSDSLFFIKCNSASGNVSIDSVHAKEIEVSTASGSIAVRDCDADFVTTNSASGDISVGSVLAKELELSAASGSITVENSQIEESGKITSASGDVELYLPRLPSMRLEASSASANITLEVPQFGENFSMTLMKRAGSGRIKCPFEYTEKTTIRYHENDDYRTDCYLVKRGEGGPDIKLATASGTIKIETDATSK